VAFTAIACGNGGPLRLGDAERGSSVVGGTIVSTVDGHAIELAEVQEIVSASDLAPREALLRLQAERLLMAEAERRGYTDADVREVAARALVQALLKREAESIEVTDQEIQRAYDADTRFHAPERRTSAHVVVLLPKGASAEDEADALGLAKAAITELEAEPAEGFVLARFRRLKHPSLKIKGERLPPLAREGRLVREFEDALFSLPTPPEESWGDQGVLSQGDRRHPKHRPTPCCSAG
jgi:hypothetical protein